MSDNRCKNERECTQAPWCRIKGECHRAAAPLAAPLVAVPAEMVLVPLKFLQGFLTLAHNYSLTAEPPDYYRGVEGDAFKLAYRRCGQDLAALRSSLPLPAPAGVEGGEKHDSGHPAVHDSPMASPEGKG